LIRLGPAAFPKKSFSNRKKGPHPAAPRQQQRVPQVNCCIFLKKKDRDPLSKKILLQKKWGSIRLGPRLSNKKKGPHPVQRHDSNSAFRR